MLDYYQKGFASAQESNCSATALPNYLNTIFADLNDNTQLRETEVDQFDKVLKAELSLRQQEQLKLDKKIQLVNTKIEAKTDLLEKLEFESDSNHYATNDQSNSFIWFAMGAIILVLLTLFLVLFYASAGYSVLFGNQTVMNSVFNPDAIKSALSKGGSAMGFTFLFPIIFIATGFALSILLSKRKQVNDANKHKAQRAILLIFLLVFLMDAMIAYKITQNIYINQYESGFYDTPWSATFLMYDVNFYLVIFMGFVVYILWGVLLNFVLSHPYTKKKVNQNENEDRKIDLHHALSHLKNERDDLNAAFQRNVLTINKNQQARQQLNNGAFTATVHPIFLKAVVDEFMKGYNAYAENAFSEIESGLQHTRAIEKVKNEWLAAKTGVTNFNTDQP